MSPLCISSSLSSILSDTVDDDSATLGCLLLLLTLSLKVVSFGPCLIPSVSCVPFNTITLYNHQTGFSRSTHRCTEYRKDQIRTDFTHTISNGPVAEQLGVRDLRQVSQCGFRNAAGGVFTHDKWSDSEERSASRHVREVLETYGGSTSPVIPAGRC